MTASAKLSKPVKFIDEVDSINFFDTETCHDRVLIVEEKRFYLQSGVLSLSSDYFRCLFNSGVSESTQKEIILEDVSSQCFEYFLKTIYPSHLVEPINWFEMTDPSFLVEALNFSSRVASPFFFKEVKGAFRQEFQFYGLSRFDLVKFIEMTFLNDVEEFKGYIFDSRRNFPFTSERKDQLMNAPSHVKNFIYTSYMEGKIQTNKNGDDGFNASPEKARFSFETADEDW